MTFAFTEKRSILSFFCLRYAVHITSLLTTLPQEGIIVALDRHFVVYPGGVGVDEGDLFYTGSSTPAPSG